MGSVIVVLLVAVFGIWLLGMLRAARPLSPQLAGPRYGGGAGDSASSLSSKSVSSSSKKGKRD